MIQYKQVKRHENNSDCIVWLNAVWVGGVADLRTIWLDIVIVFPFNVTCYDSEGSLIVRLDKVMLCIFNSATIPKNNFRFRELQPVRRRV